MVSNPVMLSYLLSLTIQTGPREITRQWQHSMVKAMMGKISGLRGKMLKNNF